MLIVIELRLSFDILIKKIILKLLKGNKFFFDLVWNVFISLHVYTLSNSTNNLVYSQQLTDILNVKLYILNNLLYFFIIFNTVSNGKVILRFHFLKIWPYTEQRPHLWSPLYFLHP